VALPQQAQALDLLAHVYNNQGNRTQAVAHWEKVVALDHRHAGAYDAMARVAFLAEEHERAVQLWNKTLAINPRMPGVHARLASAFMGLGQMQEAIAALQKAIEISPQAGQSHYMLGEAHRQLGQYELAQESFQAALRIQPDSAKVCYGLATVYLALKQTDKATAWLVTFRRLKAADVQADKDRRSQYDDIQVVRAEIAQTYTQMGIIYARHRDLRSAEQLWKRAAELDRTQVECRTNLAKLYQQTHRAQQALTLCRELAELEPGNGAHPFNMGMLHANLKEFDAALQAFQKARTLAPEKSASYRLLAQMYLETGRDTAQARTYAQQAVTLEAQAENYFVLGAVKVKQGDSAGAAEALQRALTLEPNNPKYQSTYRAFQIRMQQEK